MSRLLRALRSFAALARDLLAPGQRPSWVTDARRLTTPPAKTEER